MTSLTRRWTSCDSNGYCHQTTNVTAIIVIIVVIIVIKVCVGIAICTYIRRRRDRRERDAYQRGLSANTALGNMPPSGHLDPQAPPPPAYYGRETTPEAKYMSGNVV